MMNTSNYNERAVYDDGRLQVIEIDAPWGKPWTFFRQPSEHNFPGAVVLPITTKGHVVMVHQVRPAIGEMHTTEIPRGGVEPGETAEQCARRELLEETGLVAEEVIYLGTPTPDTGVLASRVPVFFARVPDPDRSFVSDETHLSVITMDELKLALLDGSITDAFTTYALTMAHLKGLISL